VPELNGDAFAWETVFRLRLVLPGEKPFDGCFEPSPGWRQGLVWLSHKKKRPGLTERFWAQKALESGLLWFRQGPAWRASITSRW
jgi:hypothetical protein